ncbi:MAG: DUF935 family protein, partial [Syntrophaceae bacterium]|nr:DUF935 family protein [Syntrophaceae bacterium]
RDRYGSYPSQGLTPGRLAAIFKEADQGDVARQAELFEEMEEKDLHLGGILQTRKLAVQGLEWDILPASDAPEDKQIASAAGEMMDYIENLEDFLLDALDAVGKGFVVQEIMWEMSEGQVWIKEASWVHQRRFTFTSPAAVLKTPKLLTDEAPAWGEDLPPNKFVIHTYRARSGAVSRGGILRPCAYMYLFKNYDIKDWLIFNELFSVPMRVGKYKPGAGDQEKEALKRAVFNLGVDAAAVISDDTIIEILESARRGDAGIFKELAEFCDKAMSKGVLGHTGSAEGTPGKLGGEDQARQVRQDLTEADAKALMKTIKFQVLQPWVLFNYGPDKGVPKFKFHFEAGEDLERVATVYGILVKDANFEGIPEDHIHERFGIPKAAKGEKTLKAAGFLPLANKALAPGAGKESPRPSGKESPRPSGKDEHTLMVNAGDPDWVAHYMSRLRPSLRNVREQALDDIEEWMRSLSSPPDQAQFITTIEGLIGSAFASLDRKAITDTITEIYRAYRAAPGVELAFGGPDLRAMKFLAKLDHFYISSYLRNKDAQAAAQGFLSERYLEQGAGLFGRGSAEDIQAFRDLFGQKLSDLEEWQVRRIVDTSVQRTRNWSTVAQFQDAGIQEIEIYEPTADCDFCKAINGKVISVPVAYERMMEQAEMTATEYEADMRSADISIDKITDIVGRGNLPPWHPHCHGMVIRRTQR